MLVVGAEVSNVVLRCFNLLEDQDHALYVQRIDGAIQIQVAFRREQWGLRLAAAARPEGNPKDQPSHHVPLSRSESVSNHCHSPSPEKVRFWYSEFFP
ncbi:MAG: hypothetical protein ABIK09_20955 [Pseudomonadota bacterium]